VNRSVAEAREVSPEPTGVPGDRLFRPCLEGAPSDGTPVPETVRLAPAEVALVLSPRARRPA
jgi:hypothetical protein